MQAEDREDRLAPLSPHRARGAADQHVDRTEKSHPHADRPPTVDWFESIDGPARAPPGVRLLTTQPCAGTGGPAPGVRGG
ncbi:hypothetical protein GCM10010532_082820 [Dactylosporangium siamense]|uniref:Uncharacterized protein n=1 Tax=Dactylosporangium siamense TaxID=685454 RepID=A0A919PQQ3_9ACTN|nr:hypothetical protein Dsi01nite_063750 [Dactylosporangium siamense]